MSWKNPNLRYEGSIVGGLFGGGDAAGDAAEAQQQSNAAAIEEQRRQFDITQELLSPFREAGVSALGQQLAFLGLPQLGGAAGTGTGTGTGQTINPAFADFDARRSNLQAIIDQGEPTLRAGVGLGDELRDYINSRGNFQQAQTDLNALGIAPNQFLPGTGQAGYQGSPTGFGSAFQQFAESPGQVFLREQQEKSLLRGSSAIGGLGGGNVRTALQQQAFGRGATQLGDFQNRLAALSGAGQTATTNLGQFGAQSSGNISNLLQSSGQARSSGILGQQQANSALGGQVLGAGLGAAAGGGLFGAGAAAAAGGSAGAGALLGLLSDENKKHDIETLDLKACFDAVLSMDLKSWRYIESTGLGEDLHFGPMYQNAPKMIKMDNANMLNLHDELMMIAGAIQYIKNEGLH